MEEDCVPIELYLLSLGKIVSHAFINGVSGSCAFLSANIRLEGLVKHGRGANDHKRQGIRVIIKSEYLGNLCIVPANLKAVTGFISKLTTVKDTLVHIFRYMYLQNGLRINPPQRKKNSKASFSELQIPV